MKGKRMEWAAARLLRNQARVEEGTAASGTGSLKAGSRFSCVSGHILQHTRPLVP